MTTCRTHSCWRSLTVAMSIPTPTPWCLQVGRADAVHGHPTGRPWLAEANTTTVSFAVLVMVALQRLGCQSCDRQWPHLVGSQVLRLHHEPH